MTSVLLNNVDHHDLRVITSADAAFGDAVNQVLLFPTEFEVAQRDFPIILRKDTEGQLRPVALLGLGQDENLFLDGAGGWRSSHVPLLLQRGPFSIAAPEGGAGEPRILVDPDHPRASRSQGTPVFKPHGGHSEYLERVSAVLRAIWLGNQLLEPMVTAFEEAGLLRPVNLELRTGESDVYAIGNAITIDRERLAMLPGTELEKLNQAGFLQSAFLIAASLGNMQKLADMRSQRSAAAAQG